MQANLDRGKAALGLRKTGRLVAILASGPLLATLALSAPASALTACGTSRPAGVHAAGSSGSSVHTATSRPSSGGGGGGGVGNLGCAGGSSASAAVHGLATAASGRVVERGARPAARTAVHARTARTANTGVHPRGVRRPHA